MPTPDRWPRIERHYPLGFGIEGHQIVHNNGSSHPATEQELMMWERLPYLFKTQESVEDVQSDS